MSAPSRRPSLLPFTSLKIERPIAVIYLRVSTKHGEQDSSLDTQLEECKRLCDEMGFVWRPDLIFFDRQTGKYMTRKGFNQAIGAIRSGVAQVLVGKNWQRLVRTVMFLEALKDIHRLGADVVTWDKHFDTTTADGRYILGQQLLAHEYASDKLGEETKRAKAVRKSQGYWISKPLYGTVKSAQPGIPIWDEDLDPDEHPDAIGAAPWVRKMFLWKWEGMSFDGIADRLNDAGAPNRFGGRWNHGIVASLLRSSFWRRKYDDGTQMLHKCVIPQEHLDAVDAKVKRGRPVSKAAPYLLRDLVKSSFWSVVKPRREAGEPLPLAPSTQNGAGAYRRADRARPKHWAAVDNDPVPGALNQVVSHWIDERVVSHLIWMASQDSGGMMNRMLDDQITTAVKHLQREIAAAEKEARKLTREVESTKKRLNRALDLGLDDVAKEQHADRKALAQQAQQIDSRIEAMRRDLASMSQVEAQRSRPKVNIIAELWRGQDWDLLRECIASLVSWVDVRLYKPKGAPSTAKAGEIRIYWKQLDYLKRLGLDNVALPAPAVIIIEWPEAA